MKFGQWVQSQELIDDSIALAKHLYDLAERLGIRFADAGEWNTPLAYDGVHMSEAGHKGFADGLFNYWNKGD